MKTVLSLFFLMFIFQCSKAQQITFYKDIQPIIQTKCSPCHKPEKAAPFSLLSYDDVAKRASFIKEVVQSKFMPPWKADNKYVHFVNDRSLSQKEINLIVSWIDNKIPEGIKPTNKISDSIFTNTAYKRNPDLVLKMQDSFLVKGDG